MGVPDWRTFKAGTRIRVALWLHTEVGAGGVFTKADLRDAFPGVEQIDRRMRDLRGEGWVINTYQQDRSLAPEELQLVREGGPVWERGYKSLRSASVSSKERQATLQADGFACVLCGACAGEAYPDDPLWAVKLSVVRQPDGPGPARRLSTVCDRCLAGGAGQAPDGILAEIDALPPEARERLVGWIRRGSRPRTMEEALWGRYRRLPAADRADIERHLGI